MTSGGIKKKFKGGTKSMTNKYIKLQPHLLFFFFFIQGHWYLEEVGNLSKTNQRVSGWSQSEPGFSFNHLSLKECFLAVVIFVCFAFPNKKFYQLLLGLEIKARQNLKSCWNSHWNYIKSIHLKNGALTITVLLLIHPSLILKNKMFVYFF